MTKEWDISKRFGLGVQELKKLRGGMEKGVEWDYNRELGVYWTEEGVGELSVAVGIKEVPALAAKPIRSGGRAWARNASYRDRKVALCRVEWEEGGVMKVDIGVMVRVKDARALAIGRPFAVKWDGERWEAK